VLFERLGLNDRKVAEDGSSTLYYPDGRDRKDSTNIMERVRGVKASPGDSPIVTVTAIHLESRQTKCMLWLGFMAVSTRGH